MSINSNNRFIRGFGFIEIILVMAIVLFLCYKLFNLYFKKAPLDRETSKALSEQGINAANYKTIVDSTKTKIADIQEQQMKRLEEVE